MSYLLRKINISKWEPNFVLQPPNYTADAITGCTKTKDNTLSVWHSDVNSYSHMEGERLVVAVALAMPAPDTIDLIWLEEKFFIDNGVSLVNTPGDSKYEKMNDKHKDLSSIDLQKLGVVGQHIVEQYNKDKVNLYKRFMRSELIALVKKWIQLDKDINVDILNEKWVRVLRS
ncbi:hypothetical protein [Klebsiella variicola]|uniref:hypothetical protein n=1 Tax=Klebsiella variicola TaxID=244366 RepID=UPI0010846883|nr:hypothetical protein [Klebsiella variicola]VFZ87185.1 Uncharacterised protein [Klebsiella variicola]